jgi:hypothetical protein
VHGAVAKEFLAREKGVMGVLWDLSCVIINSNHHSAKSWRRARRDCKSAMCKQ